MLAIPYVFQLLCIIHVMKNHREFYWVWIIIILPYVGGLAYLIVEILPGFLSRRNVDAVKAAAVRTLAPGKKLESLKALAAYSPSVENRSIADASRRGGQRVRAGEYKSSLEGPSRSNNSILFKAASAMFELGDPRGSADLMERLPRNGKGVFEQKAWNALWLRVRETQGSPDAVALEYEKTSSLVNDRDIDLQYLEYLERTRNLDKLSAMIEKIRAEEASLREMKVRYEKAFYRKAYALEKRARG